MRRFWRQRSRGVRWNGRTLPLRTVVPAWAACRTWIAKGPLAKRDRSSEGVRPARAESLALAWVRLSHHVRLVQTSPADEQGAP